MSASPIPVAAPVMNADFIGEAYPHQAARIADPLGAGVMWTPTHFKGQVSLPESTKTGNNDTVGTGTAVEQLATGLVLTKAADILEVIGVINSAIRE